MSALFARIKNDYLESRKASVQKDAVANDQAALKKNLLSTIIGAIESEAKGTKSKPAYEITDDVVIVYLKASLKGIETFLATTTPSVSNAEFITKQQAEARIISTYLPVLLSEEELRSIVDDAVANGVERNIKSIMSYLKENYTNRYDGALASKIARG